MESFPNKNRAMGIAMAGSLLYIIVMRYFMCSACLNISAIKIIIDFAVRMSNIL